MTLKHAQRRRETTKRPPVTSIKEVAQLARVSTATVSNTINRPDMVLPTTRARVEAAISELGYVPNQHARQLNGLSSQVLGLIVIDTSNPFFTEVARGVEDTATDSEHVVIVCNSGGSEDKERKFLRMLAGQRVRGILITPSSTDEASYDEIARSAAPVVLLDHLASDGNCSVSVNDIHGGRLAAEHLLDLGHTRIAFVGGPDTIRQHAERYRGAVEALTVRGLDPARQLARIETGSIDTAAGYAAAALALDLPDRPTAVICANDVLAFGVYRGLTRVGISVPQQMSLIGYDDIDVAADWIVPLTSVRQPATEIGREATRLLLDHTAGRADHHHEQVVFEPTLVVRQSTAPRR